MEIYEFAMKMEMDGKKYYIELKEKAENKGLKVLFNMLAQDEQTHYDTIKSLRSQVELEIESQVIEGAKNIFELMFESTNEVKTLLSEDALRHALMIEEDSIKFYEEQMNKTEDIIEKKTFMRLAKEEKKHSLLIENLLEHISGGIIRGIESAEFQQMEEDEL